MANGVIKLANKVPFAGWENWKKILEDKENVECTQEVAGLVDAFENFYNKEGSDSATHCRTGGEEEMYG
ncbi:hypothetical protein AGMMS49990_07890 [Endomicrobiia bacterium]|nr:hypothetical protein AGMMS49990_07890 [Endomicrobiia bacterium]